MRFARYGSQAMTDAKDPILEVAPLGFPWKTLDPFLFCVHHDDAYPVGNEQLGPAASLEGRNIGSDFEGKDGWRMYHGDVVPGFPQHPHRGFETVTIARKGFIDHSDSLGATARFGKGDVQWMTAGKGIVHSEMFPLVDRKAANPVELFQIWLNLPSADKLVDPHFSMFWNEQVPVVSAGTKGKVEVTVVAGRLDKAVALAPPPHSWAARATSEVAIWSIKLAAGSAWKLPAALVGLNRALYFFRGEGLTVAGRAIPSMSSVTVRSDAALELVAKTDTELLLLQGRPIGERVANYGPFVMNTREELQQAFADYERTQFGGWPWPSHGPVHPRETGRYAKHANGKLEKA